MGVITISHRGDFAKLDKFIKGYDKQRLVNILESYGQEGVRALASATPVDSGLTANSWGYRTNISKSSFSISWTNSNLTNTGTPIAILIQYGHGTRTGGYIQGRDFINPAIMPIFDKIADAVWQEVRSL